MKNAPTPVIRAPPAPKSHAATVTERYGGHEEDVAHSVTA